MNRDELLTKLAMDRVEWPIDMGQCNDFLGWEWSNEDYYPILISADGKRQITRDHWLDRRTELINEPDDADAPEWAAWKAQDSDGEWFWFAGKPEMERTTWVHGEQQRRARLSTEGKIPEGHDWKTTLREVKRETRRQLNPATSNLTNSQAREFAAESGMCSNGQPCGQNDYCDDCPNEPHKQDARRLDAQLARDMKQQRYQDAKGDDWIDEFARTATAEEFHGAMRFTIGKYNRRMGKKDDMLKEVRKMKDYCARWEQYILAKHR
jgi:hypothetical protein